MFEESELEWNFNLKTKRREGKLSWVEKYIKSRNACVCDYYYVFVDEMA